MAAATIHYAAKMAQTTDMDVCLEDTSLRKEEYLKEETPRWIWFCLVLWRLHCDLVLPTMVGELDSFLGRSTGNGSGSSSGFQKASEARREGKKSEGKKCEEFVALPRVPGKAMTDHRQRHEGEHRSMMDWVSQKPFMGDRKVSALVALLAFAVSLVRLMVELARS